MIKNSYFLNRKFLHSKNTYSPRYETEHILLCFDVLFKILANQSSIRIFEVGIGCSPIMVSIFKEYFQYVDKLKYYGIDILKYAILDSYKNIKLHNLHSLISKNIYLENIDLFQMSSVYFENKFDICISNFPYLELDEFNFKSQKYKLNYYYDKIHCVGGFHFLNKMLKIVKSKFFILEISIWQFKILKNQFNILKVIYPFVNSNICFIIIKFN